MRRRLFRTRLGRGAAATAAVIAGIAASAPAAAAQGEDREAGRDCLEEGLWVSRVDGATALAVQALDLGGRFRDPPALRHRPSQRLRLVRCEGDPAAPPPPGTAESGFAVFATAGVAGNSAYPRGGNDGALWQGRGFSGVLRPGIAFGSRFFTASLAPELVGWQNADFRHRGEDSEGMAAYRNAWHSAIDLPDRPGGAAGGELLAGQSFVRVDLGPLAAGLSTANVRFGPARHFPLLLGTAAPGFPHAFVGTSGPVWVGPLGLDLETFAGELRESGHFDADPGNDRRGLIGAFLAVSVAPVPGLWVGALRLYTDYITEEQSLEAMFRENLIDLPFVEGAANLPGNGLASVLLRWAPPGTGFELYGEYGQEDYSYNLESALREPDWTRTYNLGASKLFTGRRGVLVNAEVANISLSNPERAGRGGFTWYTHGAIHQGHTNRGQPLGAWIGPGSTAQRFALDVLTRDGLVGGYLQRVAYDEDTYYRRWSRRYAAAGHDIELTAAAHTLRGAFGGALWAELSVSHRRNRGFVVFDPSGETSSEWNVGLELQLLFPGG